MNKISLLSLCATLAVIGATFGVYRAASAAPVDGGAQARYRQGRADCTSGKTAEDRKTCLQEAGGGELHELETMIPGPAPENAAPTAAGPARLSTPSGQ